MNVRYRVELNEAEHAEVKALMAGGKASVRRVKRAQILLAADAGQADETFADNVGVGTSTVYGTKRHFVEGNLEMALNEGPRPGRQSEAVRQGGGVVGCDGLFGAAGPGVPVGRSRSWRMRW